MLRIRLTDAAFKRLEKISKSSDCRSVGEVARKILSKVAYLQLITFTANDSV